MKKYYEGAPLYSKSTYYGIRVIFLVLYLIICIGTVLYNHALPWYLNIVVVTVIFIALGSTDWKEILRTYESYKQKWEEDNKS